MCYKRALFIILMFVVAFFLLFVNSNAFERNIYFSGFFSGKYLDGRLNNDSIVFDITAPVVSELVVTET